MLGVVQEGIAKWKGETKVLETDARGIEGGGLEPRDVGTVVVNEVKVRVKQTKTKHILLSPRQFHAVTSPQSTSSDHKRKVLKVRLHKFPGLLASVERR